VAVDAAHVYWGQSGPTVARANLDGSGTPEFDFIMGDNGLRGVAVDAGHVYWTNYQDNSSIGRANLDGMSPDNAFIGDAFLPVGVAVDGAHIYWANQGTNAVARADLDGNPASVNQSFVPGADNPEGVAVDGAHIYWTNEHGGTIGRANLNGTGVDQEFIKGAEVPSAIAVDGLSFPRCQPASASTDHAESVAMTLRCTSGAGTRSYSIASQPAHGQISGFSSSTGRLTYTPDTDFFGADSFRFRASNQGGSALAATATIEVGAASNEFTIGKAKRNKRNGTAKLPVVVPGAGELDLAKTKKVKADEETADAAGREKLRVRAKGKAKKKLNRKRKAKVKAQVTYTPTGGASNTESKKIKLVRKR
jgi:sugar lactone lactonase YvrE